MVLKKFMEVKFLFFILDEIYDFRNIFFYTENGQSL